MKGEKDRNIWDRVSTYVTIMMIMAALWFPITIYTYNNLTPKYYVIPMDSNNISKPDSVSYQYKSDTVISQE